MTTDALRPDVPRRASSILLLSLLVLVLAGCGGVPPADTPAPVESPAAPSGRAEESAAAPSGSADELIPGGRTATVIRVVDGDTLHARLDGVDEKVRIIGLDTPETNRPGTPVECFAREASDAAKRLLAPGDPITLQPDPTQDTRDAFDRLLAHVFLADGSLFAEAMIRDGYAVHYVYDGVPSIHADRLAAAEDEAKANQAGLWLPAACNGDPHTEAP